MSPKGRYSGGSSGGSSGGVQRMVTVGGPLGESKGRVQWAHWAGAKEGYSGGGESIRRVQREDTGGGST